jgi:pSer/pThr/pTyr-binding forkhead associated (FHA) protein
MPMATLDSLEARLQALLEVKLLRYLPGYRREDKVPQQLASAMHGQLREQDGITYAPNVYVVAARQSTWMLWNIEPKLLEELAGGLATAGMESGFRFLSSPKVTTVIDPDVEADEIQIRASFSDQEVEETQGLPHGAEQVEQKEPAAEQVPPNAFFIFNGTQIIPLTQPVVNIGRRLDNQVVIDDPRVSRNHAQLRIVKGRFVLFDLNSSGGTFINGQRVSQSILYQGDVVSLAGVTLIFGQDLPSKPGSGGTSPVYPASADRPTAILRKDDL